MSKRGKPIDRATLVRIWILIIQDGETIRTVAEKVGHSHATVYRYTNGKKWAMAHWREVYKELGITIDVPPPEPPKSKGGKRRKKP